MPEDCEALTVRLPVPVLAILRRLADLEGCDLEEMAVRLIGAGAGVRMMGLNVTISMPDDDAPGGCARSHVGPPRM